MSIVDVNGNPLQKISAQSYSGAGNGFGKELQGWNVASKSADAALLPDFDTGNARTADLARNDGYAKNGVQLHIDHVVGHQFKLVYKPNYSLLGLDLKTMRDFIKDVEAKFTNFAEDSRCYIDAERKRTFTMLIRESVGTHCKTGEITAKAEWFKKRGSKYKTAIKLINYARISNPDGQMNNSRLRAGVKVNSRGAAVGYHIRKSHPNDGFLLNDNDAYRWIYVPRELPWGRQQLIHIFEPEGEGQSRGANTFFAAISKLKMLDKFQATTLQNAIVNAMYAAVIESDMDSAEVFKALGGGDSKILTEFMKTKAEYHEEANITLAGVKLPHLLPNEKLTMQGVNAPSSSLGDFEAGILRYISKSLGVSYEQLSGDFSKTNYSSARASMSESYRYFIGKREVVAKRFANSIFELWFEEAVMLGDIVLPKGAPSFWEMKSAWCRCNWIGAGKTQIDGLKGIKEAVEKMNAGLSTYEIEFGNMGLDYQEMFDQQDREDAELKERGRVSAWNKEASQEQQKIEINPEIHTNE